MSSYFMRRDGVLHGPYTFKQLSAAAQSGKLVTSDEISRSENGPWTLAAKIPQLAPHLPEPTNEPEPIYAKPDARNLEPDESVLLNDYQTAIQETQEEEQKKESVKQTSSPVPNRTVKPSGKLDYPAIEVPIRRTIAEWLLAIFGIVEFLCFKVLVFLELGAGIGRRFRDDNAVGATANAMELGVLVLAAWLNAIFVALIFIYIKIRQQTRIQAFKATQNEFR
jgi:hypothetical protein